MSYVPRRYHPSRTDPKAAGACDRCNKIVKHATLRKQMEWRGDALVWTGWLVCGGCLDVPFVHNRPIRIPADPVPIRNPRPDQLGVPVHGWVTDGAPDGVMAEEVVTDSRGFPVRDGDKAE